MLIAAPPSVLIAIGGTVAVSRRAFAPLREVTRAATEITAADLGRRLTLSDDDRHLGELVVAFNQLLARLEHSLEDLDRYAADVSHEIPDPARRGHHRARGLACVSLARPNDGSSRPSAPSTTCAGSRR